MGQPQEQPQYKDYINLIRKEAWKRVKRNPLVDFEELVSAGSLAFTKALNSWEPAKGMFSTHLWWQIQDCMGSIQGCRGFNSHNSTREEVDINTISLDDPGKKRPRLHLVQSYQQPGYNGCLQAEPELAWDDPEVLQVASGEPSPYEEVKFRAGLAGLSQEAMEVAWLVLSIPWEVTDWTIRWVRTSQGSIRKYLRSLGWGHARIDQAFAEVKQMLKEL
jgi:hypothetical protein